MNAKQDARSLNLFAKEDLRRRVVRAVVGEGLSKTEAARVFGVSRTSVHAWVNLYERLGEDSLTPGRPGRPRGGGQLQGWQAATIVNLITDRCPDQLRLPFALWTRVAVHKLVQQLFGFQMPIRTVGEYLKRWGFTPQRPFTRAYEKNPNAVKQWLTESLSSDCRTG